MIGYLRGKIIFLNELYVIVDVGGVGYNVVASRGILNKAKVNSEIELFIYTHVREDAIQLYGFLDPQELKLFENLITVSGIGPRTAIKIFSVGSREDIVRAIVTGDASFFEDVPRLGRK